MTDYLLVHGAGQGAWSWGRVWGFMTAPVEHPPPLYPHRKVSKVYLLDLPGHGVDADGDTSSVLLDECVQAITRAVERQGLRDLVLVGHGFAGSLILQAAGLLPVAPKRLVLVAGIVPINGKNMISVFPATTRTCYRFLANWTWLFGKDLKLPPQVIGRYLCNGIDPMEVVQAVGFFGPLPTRVLKTGVPQPDIPDGTPVSYVVLTDDRVLPPALQRTMGLRIPNVEFLDLDSCHQAPLYKPRELADILLSFA